MEPEHSAKDTAAVIGQSGGKGSLAVMGEGAVSEAGFIQALLTSLLGCFLEADRVFLRVSGMHIVMTCNTSFRVSVSDEA